MTYIAFIGLGIMGSPMAVHLAKAGHQVAGYNRSPEKAAPLVDAGGRAAASVAEAVATPMSSPDGAGLARRPRGSRGRGRRVRHRAKPGTLVIDFSSIRPDVTAGLAEQAASKGFRLIDAPVSGGEAGAINAALSIMVGGDGRRLRRRPADPGRGRQDGRARRPQRVRPDGEGGQPAHRRGQHPGARRGGDLPRGVRRGHRGCARGARRRPGRLEGAGPEEAEHARPGIRSRLPDRRCTTKISASSPRQRGKPASSFPLGACSPS